MSTRADFALWESYLQAFRRACIQENHIQAEQILGDALARAEEIGELDATLIWSGHSLAALYRMEGQWDRAAAVYRRILEAQEKILGPDHPDVANSLEKVAANQLEAQVKNAPCA